MLKLNTKSRLIYFSVAVKLKNQQIRDNSDGIFACCQMIYDEKMRFHIKYNLYCQIKVIFLNKHIKDNILVK